MKNNESQLSSLLAKIKLRDQKAFKQFYQLVSPQLFALLLKMLKQHSLAEDALQEVFIKIWNKAEQYNTNKGSIIVWAYSITRYHGYTHKELSEYLEKPIGTVKSWINRSLIFLKQCLDNAQ